MKNEIVPAIRQQKSSDKLWTDEKGQEIPFNRTKAYERTMEKIAYGLFQDALMIHDELAEFKAKISKVSKELYDHIMKENDVKKPGKGNFTWYNFDRSIKVEVSINDNITFDEALIAACQAKLNEFLNKELSDKQEFIRTLVTDAFAQSRGSLDAKKVMSLLRYRQKIKATLFQEALDLIDKSIRKPDSRTYYRVSYRDEEKKYHLIDLNFSSI